jgi:diguanylate cyclase
MIENAGRGAERLGAKAAPFDEHEHTMAVAAKAMERIRTLGLPATPRSYEVWYAYATGHYPSLNQTLNQLLARRVILAEATLDQIGNQFVSPAGIQDQIDTVSSRVSGAIDRVLAALDSTIFLTGACSDELAQSGDALADAPGRDALQAVVEKMALAVRKMQLDKRRLEAEADASKQEIDRLRSQLQSIAHTSLTDPITGLPNRRSFEDSLHKALGEAAGRGEPLALMLGDIDHFKAFNDSWGHLIGDQVLRLVASEMKRNLMERDVVARHGGEEFAIIVRDTPLPAACEMADRVRRSIMSRDIVSRSSGQNLGRVTISFGVASAHRDDTVGSLVARAEAHLSMAKNEGRNRVIGEADPDAVDMQADVA